nr:C21orf90 protein form B [Homo sapiens]
MGNPRLPRLLCALKGARLCSQDPLEARPLPPTSSFVR